MAEELELNVNGMMCGGACVTHLFARPFSRPTSVASPLFWSATRERTRLGSSSSLTVGVRAARAAYRLLVVGQEGGRED